MPSALPVVERDPRCYGLKMTLPFPCLFSSKKKAGTALPLLCRSMPFLRVLRAVPDRKSQ